MGFIESPGNSVPEAIKRNVGGMPDTLSGCFELSPDKSKRNGEILRVVVQGNTPPPPHAPEWGPHLDIMVVEEENTVVLDTPSLSPFKERLTEMTALAAEILGLKVRDLSGLRRAASGSRVHHHLRHLLRDSWINEKMYAVWVNGGNFCEIESVPTKHTWILQKIDDFFHLWLDLFQTHISLEQMIQTNWYKEHAKDTDNETYAWFTFQMMARKIGEFSEICEMRTDRSTGKFSLQQKGITRCVEQLNTRLADTVRPEADEATQKLHAEADKLTRGVKKTAMELAIDPVGLNSQLATEKKANGWGKAKEAKGDAAQKTKWGIPQEEKGDAAKKPYGFLGPNALNLNDYIGPGTGGQPTHMIERERRILDLIQIAESLHNQELARTDKSDDDWHDELTVSQKKWKLFQLDTELAVGFKMTNDHIPPQHWDPISVRAQLQEAQAKVRVGRTRETSRQKPKPFGPLLVATGTSEKDGSVIIRALVRLILNDKETDKQKTPKTCEQLQRDFEALFHTSFEDERHGTQIVHRAVRFAVLSEILGGLVVPRVIFKNGHYSVALTVPDHHLVHLAPLHEIAKNDLVTMCGNNPDLESRVFGHPFDQVDREMVRLGIGEMEGNRFSRNLGLVTPGLKSFYHCLTASPEDITSALKEAFTHVCKTMEMTDVPSHVFDDIVRAQALLRSERATRLLRIHELDRALATRVSKIESMEAQESSLQKDLEDHSIALEAKTAELNSVRSMLKRDLAHMKDKAKELEELEKQIAEIDTNVDSRKRQLKRTENECKKKKARLKAIDKSGINKDTALVTNVMAANILNGARFDLEHIIAVLTASGEAKDLAQARILSRFPQTTPAILQINAAGECNSANDSTDVADTAESDSEADDVEHEEDADGTTAMPTGVGGTLATEQEVPTIGSDTKQQSLDDGAKETLTTDAGKATEGKEAPGVDEETATPRSDDSVLSGEVEKIKM